MDAVTGQQTQNFYSLQEDVELGSEVYSETIEEMRARGVPINADPARTAQLREMVQRISSVSDLPELPYEVTLIQTNIVNAMAAPGGKIMVYEGLWDPEDGLVKDDEELAAVLAHEIAHVNCRHSTESMTRQMLPNALFLGASIFAQAKDREDLAVALSGAFMLYNGIWVTRYSRQDEIEAALRMWDRAARNRSGDDPADSIFSTHPADRVRLENLRTKLPAALNVYEAGIQNRTS
jgi:predicted Zn-dependent protease